MDSLKEIAAMLKNEPATSLTLLNRLQNSSDQAAWIEFVGRYGALILNWGRKWGLQPADAEDVAQTVLVRLAGRMGTFRYDPTRSFRAYVKTLTRYAFCDLLEARKKPGAGSGDSVVLQLLTSVEARDELAQRLAYIDDQERLKRAMVRVKARVEPHTWEAFRLTALEGLSGAETAARLGIKAPTVFKARSKVQHMLRLEASEEMNE
jgi:RNA polymerase sigma factor (sigma-70 family)